MKGNNEFHFNQATMTEAMQEYLNKRMGEFAPTVTCVFSNEYGAVFVIKTEEVVGQAVSKLESL